MAWPKPDPLPERFKRIGFSNQVFGASTFEIDCYKCQRKFEVFIADIQNISISPETGLNGLESKVLLTPSCKEHAKGYDLVLCPLEMLSDKTEVKFDEKTAHAIVDGTYRSIRLKD